MTIYYLRAKNGAIKIGYTRSLHSRRISSLSVSSPLELELVAQEEGGIDLERHRHDQYREFHIRGEWFRPSAKLDFHLKQLNPNYEPVPYAAVDDYYQVKARLDNLTSWFATNGDEPPKITYLAVACGSAFWFALFILQMSYPTFLTYANEPVVIFVLSPFVTIIIIGSLLARVWQSRYSWRFSQSVKEQ